MSTKTSQEAEEQALRAWHATVRQQSWNSDTVQVLLLEFIKTKGLMSDFMTGVRAAAAYENSQGHPNMNEVGAQYLVCEGWSHIFAGESEMTTRWVMDVNQSRLVHAAVLSNQQWVELTEDERRDLQDSLVNGNDLPAAYRDFDIEASDGLPEWAAHARFGDRPRG